MELNAAVPLAGADAELVLRLGLAAVLGLLLGLDRELRGHAAGLRTHGLICLAAATITVSVIGLYGNMDMLNADPLRLYEAAGAFIGIIGAGLIVFNKGEVQNITTAAHLFLTAVIGIACGAAQWPLVAIAAPVGLLMLSVLGLLERKAHKHRIKSADDARKT
ncbi:MgtC/SapB family protein [Erythrobacter sp.]|uniref:MgtC/SapB family protein n=1 Tax=Erythrobacter sp. TaxID=1042 RepID=UPI0025DD4B0C|nr:MgtC/SapB family protein [Erythrobacter sp.]